MVRHLDHGQEMVKRSPIHREGETGLFRDLCLLSCRNVHSTAWPSMTAECKHQPVARLTTPTPLQCSLQATMLPNWGRGRGRIKTGSSKVSFLSSAFTHFVFTNLSPCQCLCSLRELFGTSQTWKSQGEITVTDVSLLGGDTQGGAEPLHAAKK